MELLPDNRRNLTEAIFKAKEVFQLLSLVAQFGRYEFKYPGEV